MARVFGRFGAGAASLLMYTMSVSLADAAPRGYFSISFDDNHPAHYTKAAPILEQHGFRGTFYVVTNRIDKPGYMTSLQIADLIDRNHEIAVHTDSHGDLTLLTSREDRIDEILGSKYTLELFGNMYTIAYPFGAHNPTVREDVKRAGFVAARGTNRALNYRNTNRFALNSDSLKSTTTISSVCGMLSAAHDQDAWYSAHAHAIDGSGAYNITSSFLTQVFVCAMESNVSVLTVKEAACAFYPGVC